MIIICVTALPKQNKKIPPFSSEKVIKNRTSRVVSGSETCWPIAHEIQPTCVVGCLKGTKLPHIMTLGGHCNLGQYAKLINLSFTAVCTCADPAFHAKDGVTRMTSYRL